MSRLTDEQVAALAVLEWDHQVIDAEGAEGVDKVLSDCLTDTRPYRCRDCGLLFAIEPDGMVEVYAQQ